MELSYYLGASCKPVSAALRQSLPDIERLDLTDVPTLKSLLDSSEGEDEKAIVALSGP